MKSSLVNDEIKNCVLDDTLVVNTRVQNETGLEKICGSANMFAVPFYGNVENIVDGMMKEDEAEKDVKGCVDGEEVEKSRKRKKEDDTDMSDNNKTAQTRMRCRRNRMKPVRVNRGFDNDSSCFECAGGGELICCDSCPKSFHIACLPSAYREDTKQWFCPECLNIEQQGIEGLKRGYEVKSVPVSLYDENSENGRSESGPSKCMFHLVDKRSTRKNRGADKSLMNIGADYQVPFIPVCYLEAQEIGINYGLEATEAKRKRIWDCYHKKQKPNECRLVYSYSQCLHITMNNILNEYPDCGNDYETCRSLAQDKLMKYMKSCERYWPLGLQWQYSSEYVLKLLHSCGYDYQKAISCVQESMLKYHDLWDPPTRPYMNKWRPKDKRGDLPSVPFPPPNNSYKSEIRARLRQQIVARQKLEENVENQNEKPSDTIVEDNGELTCNCERHDIKVF